ncbi:hypothetical protein [Leptospira bandrabouensis]|uniref:hypothetical protein n=1 Tax=Leptospira bandrabouensis TaxID=2484903 RepID=UPI001090DC76|nr:hypothetical protein [Leptospira bandrabouensis]TGN08624.1 hypothetical protein EHR07_03655 [Leptospira bandrabouensis]
MIFLHEYFCEHLKAAEISLSVEPILYPIRGDVTTFIMVMPIQGNRSRYYPTSQVNLSIVIQDTQDRRALENAMRIYEFYRDTFNVSVSLPHDYKPEEKERSIIAKYIQAVDHPVPLGDQGNGRFQYSLNFLVQLKETT